MTVICCAPPLANVPFVGVIVSHGSPVVCADQEPARAQSRMAIVCGMGLLCPVLSVKVRLVVLVSMQPRCTVKRTVKAIWVWSTGVLMVTWAL